MPNLKAYAEAHKRGLLKGPKLSAYQELTRRGLAGVPSLPPTGTPLDATPRPAPDILTGNKEFAKKMLPKWYTREKGDEGIYAEPPLDLGLMVEDAALGPVKVVGKADKALRAASKVGYMGLSKPSQRAAESALRSEVFKINKTDDVKKGFDKIINEFSEEFGPENLVNEFLYISNDRQILRESIEEVFGNRPPKEARGLYDEAFETWAESRVDDLRDRMLEKMDNYRSGLRKIKKQAKFRQLTKGGKPVKVK